ncbi:hypothetical protein GCM10025795_43810 [Verticiella sediminum]
MDNTYRNQLISYYRGLGTAGRCPERSGYTYWLDDWWSRASAIGHQKFNDAGGAAAGNVYRDFLNKEMPGVWDTNIRRAIDASAATNNEQGAGGIAAGNNECQRTANQLWPGLGVKAEYVLKSGNRCKVIS